jgi:serine/threonine protein kinase
LLVYVLQEGKYHYPSRVWSTVSTEARDLIDKMIVKKVDGRISAADVLRHPWITSYYEDPLSGTIAANFQSPQELAVSSSPSPRHTGKSSEQNGDTKFPNGDLAGNLTLQAQTAAANDSYLRVLFNNSGPGTPPVGHLSPKSPHSSRKSSFNNGFSGSGDRDSPSNMMMNTPSGGVSSIAGSPSPMIDTTMAALTRQYRSPSLLHPIIEIKDCENEMDKLLSGASNIDDGHNRDRRILVDGNSSSPNDLRIASRRKSFENVATIEVLTDSPKEALESHSSPNHESSPCNSTAVSPIVQRSPRSSFTVRSPRSSIASSPIIPSPKVEETKERDSLDSVGTFGLVGELCVSNDELETILPGYALFPSLLQSF